MPPRFMQQEVIVTYREGDDRINHVSGLLVGAHRDCLIVQEKDGGMSHTHLWQSFIPTHLVVRVQAKVPVELIRAEQQALAERAKQSPVN